MLAKCYIEVLGLDKHSEAATRLIKWKQPVDGQVSYTYCALRSTFAHLLSRYPLGMCCPSCGENAD